jgi:hypothetical protein
MFLKRLLESVKDIKDLIRKQIKRSDAENKLRDEASKNRNDVKAEIRFDPETVSDNKDVQDRNYGVQNSIRRATWCAFFAASLYAGVAAFQLTEMRKATKYTGDVATISAKQLDIAERPWIKMQISPAGPLTLDQYGLTNRVRIDMQNFGNSPAISVLMQSQMFLNTGWPTLEVAEKRNKLCNDLKHQASTSKEELETMFPGTDVTTRFWNVNVPKSDVDQILKTGNNRAIPLIVSCVVYRSTFNDAFHETAYWSTVMTFDRNQQNGIGMAIPLGLGSSINPTQLFIANHTHAN